MIKLTIQSQLKDAMRAKDSLTLDALRYILSQIKYAEIEKQHELSDEEALAVLSNEVKKRREGIRIFKDSGRTEIADEEEKKLAVILALMPAQMTSAEIASLVDAAIAKVGKDNMGAIMKELMPATKGKADGGEVSRIVREKMGAK